MEGRSQEGQEGHPDKKKLPQPWKEVKLNVIQLRLAASSGLKRNVRSSEASLPSKSSMRASWNFIFESSASSSPVGAHHGTTGDCQLITSHMRTRMLPTIFRASAGLSLT